MMFQGSMANLNGKGGNQSSAQTPDKPSDDTSTKPVFETKSPVVPSAPFEVGSFEELGKHTDPERAAWLAWFTALPKTVNYLGIRQTLTTAMTALVERHVEALHNKLLLGAYQKWLNDTGDIGINELKSADELETALAGFCQTMVVSKTVNPAQSGMNDNQPPLPIALYLDYQNVSTGYTSPVTTIPIYSQIVLPELPEMPEKTVDFFSEAGPLAWGQSVRNKQNIHSLLAWSTASYGSRSAILPTNAAQYWAQHVAKPLLVMQLVEVFLHGGTIGRQAIKDRVQELTKYVQMDVEALAVLQGQFDSATIAAQAASEALGPVTNFRRQMAQNLGDQPSLLAVVNAWGKASELATAFGAADLKSINYLTQWMAMIALKQAEFPALSEFNEAMAAIVKAGTNFGFAVVDVVQAEAKDAELSATNGANNIVILQSVIQTSGVTVVSAEEIAAAAAKIEAANKAAAALAQAAQDRKNLMIYIKTLSQSNVAGDTQPPAFSSLSPMEVPPDGGDVQVTGLGFDSNCVVSIDGAAVSTTVASNSLLTFSAPPGKPQSKVSITITNPGIEKPVDGGGTNKGSPKFIRVLDAYQYGLPSASGGGLWLIAAAIAAKVLLF